MDEEDLRHIFGESYPSRAEPGSPEFWHVLEANVRSRGADARSLYLIWFLKQGRFRRYLAAAAIGYAFGAVATLSAQLVARAAQLTLPEWVGPFTVGVPVALLLAIPLERKSRSQIVRLLRRNAA